MENETSKGTWTGVTVIAIVAVLGMAFAIFAIARTMLNKGQGQFAGQVESISNATFTDFDGTTVSGVKIRSALEDMEGQNVAILVNTAAFQKAMNNNKLAALSGTDSSVTFGSKDNLVTKVNYGGKSDDGSTQKHKNLHITALPDGVTGSSTDGFWSGATSFKAYAIYNAQLEFKTTAGTTATLKLSDDGYYEWNGSFATEAGNIVFNNVKDNWKNEGCTEYIAPASNFSCKLIKDVTGAIVGIVCSQVYSYR